MKKIKYFQIVFCIYLFTFLASCSTTEKRVETEKVNFAIITDSLYTRMPGTLLISDNYLIWEDPFSFDKFMNIIDLKERKDVGSIGGIGQGPEEFNTPVISGTYDNRIFVFDLNTKHQAFYSLDSFNNKQNPYSRYIDNQQQRITNKINIAKGQFVVLQPAESNIFKFISETDSIEFGSSILASNNPSNMYDINQGIIRYNVKENKLVFASFLFPFIEVFSINSNIVTPVFRSQISTNLFSKAGNEIKVDASRSGCMDMSLTQDYIVTIQRDYEKDKTDESTVGMDFSKLPKTLFLYDYKGNLKKIVDVGIPIFRVAGCIQNNTAYAIGVNPDFTIIEIEL